MENRVDKNLQYPLTFRSPNQDRKKETALPPVARKILDMESQWWKYPGAKEQAIRELFRMSPTQYYQVLTGIISSEEALAYAPMVVNRLRQLRAARMPQSSARRLKAAPR